MKIQILIDNPKSWIIPYAIKLQNALNDRGHSAILLHKHKDIEEGDILLLLACERVFKALNKNKHNLVVHESDLPKGKGWSPVTWQVLEGKNKIPITLFEAEVGLDSGPIYLQDFIELEGHELNNEIKHKQGIKTNELILNFIDNFGKIFPKKQIGEETYYSKRKPEDSKLDINKTINDQFNLLRVVDNERYPAFFEINGQRYILKIYKQE